MKIDKKLPSIRNIDISNAKGFGYEAFVYEITNIKDGKIRAGFIAQDLQSGQTDCDYLDLVMDNNPDKLEAKQEHLIPVLVQAVKELSAKNDALEARLATLEGS